MDAMTIVEIRNEHPTRTHNIDYYRNRYTLAPGKKVMVPWECAISVLGDPRIYNTGRLTARRDEYARMRRYWGLFDGFDTPAQEEAKQPRLAVYDQQGERIWMLMDDPEGQQAQTSEHLTGTSPDRQPADRTAALEQQVAALLSNQNRLLALLEARAPGLVEESLPTLVPAAPEGEAAGATGPAVDPTVALAEPPLDLDVSQLVGTSGAELVGTVGTELGEQLIPEPAPGTGAVADSPTGRARAGAGRR